MNGLYRPEIGKKSDSAGSAGDTFLFTKEVKGITEAGLARVEIYIWVG